MATDSLVRLSGTPVGLTASAATVYTSPAATVTTIRNIHVANEGLIAYTFTLSIGTDGAGKRFFYTQTVPQNDSFDWSGVLVLAANEIIQAYANVTSVLTLTMSGVQTL